MKMSEDENLITAKEIYSDLKYEAELISDILDKVVEVGDLETLIEIEHLLDKKEEYARQRDVTKRINKKIKNMDGFEVKENEE